MNGKSDALPGCGGGSPLLEALPAINRAALSRLKRDRGFFAAL